MLRESVSSLYLDYMRWRTRKGTSTVKAAAELKKMFIKIKLLFSAQRGNDKMQG